MIWKDMPFYVIDILKVPDYVALPFASYEGHVQGKTLYVTLSISSKLPILLKLEGSHLYTLPKLLLLYKKNDCVYERHCQHIHNLQTINYIWNCAYHQTPYKEYFIKTLGMPDLLREIRFNFGTVNKIQNARFAILSNESADLHLEIWTQYLNIKLENQIQEVCYPLKFIS